jgi:hypothetical protein
VGLNEDSIRFGEEDVVVGVVVGRGSADLWEVGMVFDPPILEGGVMSVLAVLASVTDEGVAVEEGLRKNIVAAGQERGNGTLTEEGENS